MSKTIRFLGWDQPATDTVARYILNDSPPPLAQMDGVLIVVPTKEAGRRLREKMMIICRETRSALLDARIVTPLFFIQSRENIGSEAGATLVRSVWIKTLLSLRKDDCQELFPRGIPENNHQWALAMSKIIQQLREELSDACLSINSVLEKHETELQELPRWRDLGTIETMYLENLKETGRSDPCELKLANAKSPSLRAGVKKIILASVPDPSLLALATIKALSGKLAVEILVMAPDNLQDHFDDWGRPLPDKWSQRLIDIPDKNIVMAGTPAGQARSAAELIRAAEYQLQDICIGVPDRDVIPHMQNRLEDAGLTSFDPADRPVKDHHLYHLVKSWRRLTEDSSFISLAGFLHEADVLECLREERSVNACELLAELDLLQNTALPQTMRDAELALKKHSNHSNRISVNRIKVGTDCQSVRSVPAGQACPALPPAINAVKYSATTSLPHYPNLKKAFEFADEVITAARKKPLEEALREFLQRVFAAKTLAGHSDDDADFKAVAALISDILNDITYARPYLKEHLAPVVTQLIIETLDEAAISRRREGALIDLNGWMELPWNDAPLMIITGFNEGLVPTSRKSDIFLPDSLKKILGLRNNETQFSRDAYLLSLILATRAKDGRVILMAGKTSQTGDPLKPSRLLFRCPDGQLPERAAFIFGELEEEIHNPPFSVSFKLDPAAPLALGSPLKAGQRFSYSDGRAGQPCPAVLPPFGRTGCPSLPFQIPMPEQKPQFTPTELRVTQFRDYLACPFRFFLKHVLKMERTEFKEELDALDFGTAIHFILEKFAGDPEINRSTDPVAIQKRLDGLLDDYFKRIYGTNDSFAILYARGIAAQRLKAFARCQAEAASAGWEIAEREFSCRMTMAGMTVSGKIDRIDVNRHDGKMRIIDYKTSDSAQNPEKAHLKKTRKEIPDFARHAENEQWIDLQLPLYWHLFKATELSKKAKRIELCYFNLPSAVSGSGIDVWENFDESIAASALKSAEQIIERIKHGIFWPPSDSVAYDDFESLHNKDIQKYFDGEKLSKLMENNLNSKQAQTTKF